MNFLSVENLTKSFGERVLFRDLNFGLLQGDKTALVARNGTGKTTLLNIITGKDTADSGDVAFNNNIAVGFLPQVPHFDETKTVIESIFAAQNPMIDAVKEYEDSLEAAQDGSEKNLDRLNNAMALMDDLKAWDFEVELKKVLSKLNITNLNQLVKELSGGQRKRVALAKVILENPDLLILDEPTNHLDVDMIEWLEEYLARATISLLLVTHDRYFLDRVCNQIIEIDNEQIYKYEGNYEQFLVKKAEREANEAINVDKAKNLLKKELDWMRRQPKARSTKAKYRVDAFYDLKDKASAGKRQSELQLDVQMSRLGSKILELDNLKKRYDDLVILDDFNYVFKKRERIGIVGQNGVGKSTFLNMIMGLENADSGEITKGETVVFGYYHQQGLKLAEDKRIIEVVTDIAEVIPMGKKGEELTASQFLNHFQFSHKQQYDYVSQLSGGEKRRLYLLTVLMKNPNFLILDEPTNDLDLQTLQTLEEFLDNFSGCLMIVSHDRYFMDRLADHLFIFEGEGKVKDFNGKYSEYRDYKKDQERQKEIDKKAKKAEVVYEPVHEDKRKLSFKEKQEYTQLEGEIEALETEKASIEALLVSGETDHEKLQGWADEVAQLMAKIEEKSERWLELAEFV